MRALRKCELPECDVMFEPARDDKRFHSDGCRSKANKARKRVDDREPDGMQPPPANESQVGGPDRLAALEERVEDLASVVEFLEGCHLRQPANRNPTPTLDQLRDMIRAEVKSFAGGVSGRLQQVEQHVRELHTVDKPASPADETATTFAEHDEAIRTLARRIDEIRDELDRFLRDLQRLADA